MGSVLPKVQQLKKWSSPECKSNLMYVLEGKAAEFFASLHEREPTLFTMLFVDLNHALVIESYKRPQT